MDSDTPGRSPLIEEFAAGYDFGFDDYQLEALAEIEAGSGVLVAAPTGAGKTVAGEFAVFRALQQGRKCFYTTPIKALSNQKYADLVARHGSDRVGLLTGDSSINSEAPVVVMTTEVLRNMIYANSSTLSGLGYVVMDEVHYLADRFRGAVWEEVIIGLAESIQLVALSATVSNAEEFGEWLAEVRGRMAVVVSERRPVPLYQHVLVGRKVHDLFADESADVNPELLRVAKEEARHVRDDSRRPRGRSGKGKRKVGYGSGRYGGAHHRSRDQRGGSAGRPRSLVTPSRPDLIEALDQRGLLPAIVFIFSRVGCDAAVRQVLSSRIRLTRPQERDQITEIVARHTSGLSADDLVALNHDQFLAAMQRGIAAHHAGMLPAFKECVEEAFVKGLVKVVFATETLALGINMPARSVVLEKLVKFNGDVHADITPGEYTQLTGRAGRRGIDVEGHAVVQWQPGLDPRAVAGLASKRTYPLKSSFAPTYNMAVNLVGRVGRERARALLEQSFAQFQTDKSVVGLARSLTRNSDAIAEHRRRSACDRGDFDEYADLREEISQAEAVAARARKSDRRAETLSSLLTLRPGDIIEVPHGRSAGYVAVIDPGRSQDRDGPTVSVMTEDKHVRQLRPADFPAPVVPVGTVKIPKHFNVKDPSSRRNLHAAFRSRLKDIDPYLAETTKPPVDAEARAEIDRLRAKLQAHPCHRCPDREEHARWAERAIKLERDNRRTEQQMARRTNTIARHFDKICQVLESLGYLGGDDGDEVTDDGRMLARIYNELDLVAAECIRVGILDGLTAPQLAAVLASLVYESRRSDHDRRPPRMPDAASDDAMNRLRKVWREVSLVERDARLERGPEPDIGFSEAAFAWASGRPLNTVLSQSGLTAGDFVRWVRQVLDFADQVANAAGRGQLRFTAREVVHSMRRGVVAFVPETDDEEDALQEQD